MVKKGKAKAKAAPAAPSSPLANGLSKQQEEEEAAENQRLWKEKAEANAKKAQEAQAEAQRQNARRQEWERQEQNKARDKAREDRKWEEKVQAAKQRAKGEGVLESEDWGDGKWWVKRDGGLYQEVQDMFFCTMCQKHLNTSTLEAHLDSDGHKKKLAWEQPTPATSAAAPRPAAAAGAAAPRPAPAATAAAAAPWAAAGAALEEWQEMSPAGVRCIPCGKVIDDNHVATDDHKNRLRYWLESQRARKFGRPPPKEPYLAWVPWEPSMPDGERCLKCLLCNKWVQDETSHTGTFQVPAGTKEHMKHLRNVGTDTSCRSWYEAHVVPERRKWHPDEPRAAAAPSAAPAAPSARAGPAAGGPATPAPWAAKAPPAAAAAAPPAPAAAASAAATPVSAPRWGKAAAPPAAVPAAASAAAAPAAAAPAPAPGGHALPPGWEMATDAKSGNPYYYNRTSGDVTWAPPPMGKLPPPASAPPAAPPAAAAPAAAPAPDDDLHEC